MPQLFVVPAREERGEDRVHAGAGNQQVGEVEGDVVLDVHHVVEAEKVALRQWMRGDLVPRDACRIDLLRLFFVAIDAEAHTNPYEFFIAVYQCGSENSQPPHKEGSAGAVSLGRDAPRERSKDWRQCSDRS